MVQLDGDSHLLVMTRAAGAARTWKADLLAGHVDDEVAASVGSLIGRWHAATFGDLHAEEAFGDLEAFVQLRVDPFHRTLAGRHPALAGRIEDLAGALLDDGRRCCLVHGDLSPKNVLVGASDASVWVIDWEVAHFGNPVFDLAFTLCHLGCKAAHRPADASRLAGTSTRFLDSYAEAAPALRARIPDGELVAHTACLMLARVDGKSPAEYLDEGERDAVRSLATHLLRSSDLGLDAIFHA